MRTLSDHRAFVVVCLVLLGASASRSSAESPGPTYRSTVSEVRLTFFATDERNHSADTLQKNDFAVVDNERVVRDFRSFSVSSETKLDVVVLIDSSQSVLPHFKDEISNVLQLVGQAQWIPDDKITVLSFAGTEPRVICTGNCRSSSATGGVSALSSDGTTPLFDTVAFAANFLSERSDPEVRPVIILFSDGEDTISRTSFHDAFEKVLASEAQIYAVDVTSPGRSTSGTATLQRLAEASGGRYLPVQAGAVEVLHAVVDDLHSAHVVTYALPAGVSDFHSVRILPTRNLNLQFRCRRGYYARAGTH